MVLRLTPVLKNVRYKLRSDGVAALLHAAGTEALRHEHFFDLVTRIRYHAHRMRYEAPSPPYRPIWVNPSGIDLVNTELRPLWGLGQIVDGKWDNESYCKPVEYTMTNRGLRQRFLEGRPWRDTAYVEMAERKFASGGSKWDYEDLDHFLDVRCAYVDDLYERIKNDGYRPNYASGHSLPFEKSSKNTRHRAKHRLEPLVVIGRNGDLYLSDGYHRHVIADILGIDSIPVNVLARHHEWQCTRDLIARGECESSRHKPHPDFADLR